MYGNKECLPISNNVREPGQASKGRRAPEVRGVGKTAYKYVDYWYNSIAVLIKRCLSLLPTFNQVQIPEIIPGRPLHDRPSRLLLIMYNVPKSLHKTSLPALRGNKTRTLLEEPIERRHEATERVP